MNRGVARRSVFESKGDTRQFLARVARAVRRGEIEVHCFVLLTTHFHMLVRSPTGKMSEAMRRIQNEYVRWFNRKRRRDGPLFRGRFTSKPVTSRTYRRLLVRYIDQNAPLARLASAAELYPYGSAAHYAHGKGPPWLSRGWIEQEACRISGSPSFDTRAYRRSFGRPLTDGEAEFVARRSCHAGTGPDPLDDLVAAAPERVRAWMVRKAQLADGTRPGIPLVPPSSLVDAVSWWCRHHADPDSGGGRPAATLECTLLAGLLRQVAGETQASIASRLGLAQGSLARIVQRHDDRLSDEASYQCAVGEILSRVFDESGWGGG